MDGCTHRYPGAGDGAKSSDFRGINHLFKYQLFQCEQKGTCVSTQDSLFPVYIIIYVFSIRISRNFRVDLGSISMLGFLM